MKYFENELKSDDEMNELVYHDHLLTEVTKRKNFVEEKKIINKLTENDPGSLFGVGAFSVDVIIRCI